MSVTTPDADVIVVGAGLAGLRCATVLTEAGREVVVLEAGDHVGGRVATDVIDGYVCERGFQVLNPAYPAVRRWVDVDRLHLRRFDAGALARAADGLRVVADPLRAPHLALPTLRSGLVDPVELWHLGRWLAPALARPQASTRHDDAALADALDQAGVTGHLRRVIDRFLAGVLVESAGSTSANYVRLLLRCFALGRPGLPSGGMQRLPEQLAAGLRDVRLGTPVRAVHPADGARPARVETDAGDLSARHVVVATDPTAAGVLAGIPPVPMKGLTTWWYATDEPPDRRRLLVVDGRGGVAPPGPVWNAAVVTMVAPEHAPPARHLVQATTLLDRSDGQAPDADVRAHLADIYSCDTARWEVVTHHLVPEALPASPPPLRLRHPQRVAEGVLVCGDHRDTSSLQGALVSGDRAARRLLTQPFLK